MSSAAAFSLSCDDFAYGETIPVGFTCRGKDQKPALSWQGAPEGTKSFVLIMDDPDAPAGTWTHWVLYNIPSTANAVSDETSVGTAAMNSALKADYAGPCPPEGTGVHRYFFKLYALDTPLDLQPYASRAQVENAMTNHILGEAEYMGTRSP